MSTRDLTAPAPVSEKHSDEMFGRTMLSKVPQITALFWIIKILTTGMGEAASDWLLNGGEGLPGLGLLGALVIDATLIVVAFALQFAARRYIPQFYWFAVAAVGIVGTVVADIMHFVIGLPLWATITLYGGVIVINFLLWHRLEKTVSIHSITTRRREIFYWVTVFFTFALGTAVGDLTAMAWNLGFLGSGIMFLVVIAVPAAAHRWFKAGAVFWFWFAYVITRPLGASFADWLAVPPNEGGLGYGAGPVTLVSTILIAVLVTYVAVPHRRTATRSDQQPALES